MAQKVEYTAPTTGLRAISAAAPDAKIERRFTGRGSVTSDHTEPFLITDNTSYPFAQLCREETNRFQGGPFTPHARLNGKQAYLTVAAAALATEFHVEQYLTPDGRPIFEAGGHYLVMHRLPYPEEELDIFTSTSIAAEIVTISVAYDWTTDTGTGNNDGSWPTITAPALGLVTARERFAVVQQIAGCTASYNMRTGDLGYMQKLEQLTVISISSAVDGGAQTIDVVFTENTDFACHGYAIQILKIADVLCLDDTPVSIPEWVIPSQVSAKSVLTPAAGVITVSGLSTYYSSATHKLEAIVAGSYYVCVRALNQIVYDADLRMSAAAISSGATGVGVVVA